MQIQRHTIVFDAPDLAAESGFWASVLGGSVETSDDWHTVRGPAGDAVVAVQLAPGLVAPDWPDGAPQQIHLDLFVEDIATAHAEILGLGARLLQDADRSASEGFVVYADPAGHPFCLCWG